MSFTRVRPGGWGTNEKLTATQITALDENVANALDKRGDSVSSGKIISWNSGSYLDVNGTFTLKSGAVGYVDSTARFAVNSGGKIQLANGGTFEALSGSTVDVKSGATLTMSGTQNASGNLNLYGQETVKSGGVLSVESGGFIQLDTVNQLRIAASSALYSKTITIPFFHAVSVGTSVDNGIMVVRNQDYTGTTNLFPKVKVSNASSTTLMALDITPFLPKVGTISKVQVGLVFHGVATSPTASVQRINGASGAIEFASNQWITLASAPFTQNVFRLCDVTTGVNNAISSGFGYVVLVQDIFNAGSQSTDYYLVNVVVDGIYEIQP